MTKNEKWGNQWEVIAKDILSPFLPKNHILLKTIIINSNKTNL